MLRKARLRKGYTQQQLADLVDTQLRQYQRLEYGEREIRNASMKLQFMERTRSISRSHRKSGHLQCFRRVEQDEKASVTIKAEWRGT